MSDAITAKPLTLDQVHPALTYYYDHQEEIEAPFADDNGAPRSTIANAPNT
jgi:hypothetical protein